MKLSIQPELKSLLKEVVLFLSQLGESSAVESQQTKAEDLKKRIEDLCFEPVEEEIYDEAGVEELDSVPELPKGRPNVGSATLTSPKGSVRRKSASASWQCEEILEVAASSFTNPIKQGLLEKKRPENNKLAKMLSAYQKRYCVIDSGVFYYFESPTSKKQSGAFSLKEYEARPAYHLIKSITRKEGSFELVSPGQRSFQFLAKDFEELKEWISAISKCSDIKHPDVSTLSRPSDAPADKNIGMSSGSDTESLNISAGVDTTDDQSDYQDADNVPALSKRPSPSVIRTRPPPLPEGQDIYDEAGEEQETYDEAGPAKPETPLIQEQIYDEAGMEEETYDEAGEAVAPPSKPLPVIPPVGRRNVPKPPIPDDHTGRPLPPPPQVQQPKTIHVTSDDYENMFYGLWDCDTSISHELAFSSGDIIHVVDKDHDGSGWWTGLLNGKIGLVPKSYLSAAYAAA